MDKQKTEEKEIIGKLIDSSTPTIQGDEGTGKQYKEIDVYNTNMSMSEIMLGMFLTTGFSLVALMVIWASSMSENNGERLIVLLFGSPFIVVASFFAFVLFNSLFREMLVKLAGKEVKGMIIKSDNEKIGHYNILVMTSDGYRYFHCQLDEKVKIFKVKEIVNLKVLHDMVYINLHGGGNERIEDLLNGSTDYCKKVENANDNNQYVVCKEANVNFWNSFFYVFLGSGFVLPLLLLGGALLLSEDASTVKIDWIVWVFIVTFALIGACFLYIAFNSVYKYIMTVTHGKTVTGVVCGYSKEGMNYNHQRGTVYTIQINTCDGCRLIRYDMHGPETPFLKGELVDLMIYGDYFLVRKKNRVIRSN